MESIFNQLIILALQKNTHQQFLNSLYNTDKFLVPNPNLTNLLRCSCSHYMKNLNIFIFLVGNPFPIIFYSCFIRQRNDKYYWTNSPFAVATFFFKFFEKNNRRRWTGDLFEIRKYTESYYKRLRVFASKKGKVKQYLWIADIYIYIYIHSLCSSARYAIKRNDLYYLVNFPKNPHFFRII